MFLRSRSAPKVTRRIPRNLSSSKRRKARARARSLMRKLSSLTPLTHDEHAELRKLLPFCFRSGRPRMTPIAYQTQDGEWIIDYFHFKGKRRPDP